MFDTTLVVATDCDVDDTDAEEDDEEEADDGGDNTTIAGAVSTTAGFASGFGITNGF
jgi:hypothetical protein